MTPRVEKFYHNAEYVSILVMKKLMAIDYTTPSLTNEMGYAMLYSVTLSTLGQEGGDHSASRL